MKIFKTRDVKTPTRGTEGSAGLDFYVPNDFPGTHFLAPNEDVLIPSGIFTKIPTGYMLYLANKGSVAKRGLQVGACAVDEDYQGEIFLHVRNVSSDMQEINAGEKIVQGILLPVLYDGVQVVDSIEELYPSKTKRGAGCLGSTNNK